MYNETYRDSSDNSANIGYNINNTITVDIVQRITACVQSHCIPAFTITKIEELDRAALEARMCETDNSIAEDWNWVDRVFQVSYILHDWVDKGESMESHQIVALPKQHMIEILPMLDPAHKPLSVYTIHESETL